MFKKRKKLVSISSPGDKKKKKVIIIIIKTRDAVAWNCSVKTPVVLQVSDLLIYQKQTPEQVFSCKFCNFKRENRYF